MGRLWNKLVRWGISTFGGTGLEQELNQGKITGELVIPELAETAREMAAEGIVLLKNEKQTLPILPQNRVAVFGRCAADYFTVGYGSGGDVIPPYRSSLMDGLRQQGVRLEENLVQRYAHWCTSPRNVPDEGYWGNWPMNYPEMPLSDDIVCAAAANSDLALVVIGRAAGEDRENKLKKGSYYLTDPEMQMLHLVTKHFDKVCVIMDCGNIIDMSWTKDFGDSVTAIVYAWQGGMESGYALADVLTGRVSPSGCLTDTIAESYDAYPGSSDFGGLKCNNYTEDIYVGYRYFETFCKEKVLYPFGFGLSYTDFAVQTHCSREREYITAQVTVTNIGTRSGKQVAQAYLGLPQGKLSNPDRILAAFGKTRTLAPGESQMLELSIDLKEFAPFDDSGVTGNPNAYVLEAGTYRLFVGKNVRDAQEELCFERERLQVIRQLSEAAAVRKKNAFDRMVNRNGRVSFEPVPTACKDLKEQILRELPDELIKGTEEYTFGDLKAGRCTAEEFTAQLTPQELDDITHGQGKMNSNYGISGNAGAFGGVTEQLRSRGIPAVITTDGPSGVRIRRTVGLLPCGTALASSFNPEGVEALYSLVSREMAHFGSHMLLAPGMNIHRSPLCGRNFEYYSEDPYLTGKIGAAAIRGIQSAGRSACPKHFACNNQERNRNRNDSRLSQRALREIYLRGFEIAIREADPRAIMTSYNLVNGTWAHYHYELVTQILRKEWGYEGLVITDWWMQPAVSAEFPNLCNDAYRIRAQVDVLMPGEFGRRGDPKARSLLPSLEDAQGVTLAEAQRSALNVIRFLQKLPEE